MSREMKNSGIPWIGDIPKGWNIENIGSCLKEVHNLNSDCSEDNALQFKMGTIISKKHGDSKYNPETLEAYNIVQVGDIVINGLNLSFDFISMRVGQVKENGVITSAYLTVRPLSHLDSDYVTYLFKGYDACKALHGMGKGLRQTLSYKEFRKYLIFHPSLSEQQKIASFLDRKCSEIDEMIALQEKIVEELKAYKQSVITEAVTKGLNPDVPMKDSGIEWIGEIPEHWEVGRMKNLCNQNPNSLSEKTDKDIEFDYVDIGSVSFEKGVFNTEHYKFSEAPSRARRKANFGDFIMSTVRTYLRAIDVIDTQEKANYIYSTGFAVLTPKAHISYKFLSYISKSQYFLEQVTTLSRGINYPSINSTDLMTICVAHPSIEEQIQISDYLDKRCTEIDNLISIKLSKIDSLKEYKKSIIYEYVTGKKEVIE